MSYATQMEAARAGVVTPQMQAVAQKEGRDPAFIRDLVARGRVAIPANVHHAALDPNGIGFELRTKINVNLGTSRDWSDLDMEMSKARTAVALGAESIMDLSCCGDTRTFRRKLVAECPAIIGTVPIYDAVVHYHKPLGTITPQEWIDALRMHAEDGVDFVTLHCAMNRESAARIKRTGRVMNVVSRGGALMFAWMEMTGNENPFYERFDEVLDICRAHDVTISLGDSCRPGCLADAGDEAQTAELVTLGELVTRAWERDVQVIVEGPGHVPLDQVAAQMKLEQTVCHGAPFYVLGPLVTDVAPGYDHITAAIGGAVAATAGASFLCYVTPAEHLRLPDEADVREGIIAFRIAAHAADVAKGLPHARDWDDRMARARQRLDWEAQFAEAIDPEKARRYRAQAAPEEQQTCSMCGNFCSVKNMNDALAGLEVNVIEADGGAAAAGADDVERGDAADGDPHRL